MIGRTTNSPKKQTLYFRYGVFRLCSLLYAVNLMLWFLLISFTSFSQDNSLINWGPGGVNESNSNVLWLLAREISGVSDGEDLVTAWRDSSGNHHHFSKSNTDRLPSFQTKVINGLPVVRFNGASEVDYLDDDHLYNARTVFAVYRIDPSLQDRYELGQILEDYMAIYWIERFRGNTGSITI